MIPKYLRQRLDIVIAVVVFVASTAGSFLAYASIIEKENTKQLLFPSIVEGTMRYALLHGTKCIGLFESTLQKDKSFELHTKGQVRLSMGDTMLTPDFDASAHFNPIGQLTDGNVLLRVQNTHTSMSFEGANPLSIHLADGEKTGLLAKDFSVPGPVLLTPEGKFSYRLEYPLSQKSESGFLHLFTQGMFQDITLTLSTSGDDVNACQSSQERLDILPLVQRLQQTFGSLLQLADKFYGSSKND